MKVTPEVEDEIRRPPRKVPKCVQLGVATLVIVCHHPGHTRIPLPVVGIAVSDRGFERSAIHSNHETSTFLFEIAIYTCPNGKPPLMTTW